MSAMDAFPSRRLCFVPGKGQSTRQTMLTILMPSATLYRQRGSVAGLEHMLSVLAWNSTGGFLPILRCGGGSRHKLTTAPVPQMLQRLLPSCGSVRKRTGSLSWMSQWCSRHGRPLGIGRNKLVPKQTPAAALSRPHARDDCAEASM